MNDGNRWRVLVPAVRPRGRLSRRGEERLLAAAKDSPRALALYLLAVRAGLGARECAGLDVGDVSTDGVHAAAAACLRVTDRRRSIDSATKTRAIDDETRVAIEAYLLWRRDRCAHFKLRLRTVSDARGTVRCHACREVTDFLRSPLFLGRQGQRVAAQWLREEFRGIRRRVRLPAAIRFGQLGRNRLLRRSVGVSEQADVAGGLVRGSGAIKDVATIGETNEERADAPPPGPALVPRDPSRS